MVLETSIGDKPRLAGVGSLAALCMVAGLAAGACTQVRLRETETIDLATHPAELRWQMGRLDLGRGDLDAFLGDGWFAPEVWADGTRVRWSSGPSASLRFVLDTPRDLVLNARVAPHGAQRSVRVVLNDVEVDTWWLPAGFTVQRLDLARTRLRGGTNVLTIHPSEWPAPSVDGTGDRRRLAIAWSWLEFEGVDDAEAPRQEGRQGLLNLPRGSELEWSVGPATSYRLDADRVVAAGDSKSELVLETRCDATRPVSRSLTPRETPAALALYSPAPGSPCIVSLRATGGDVRVVRPRLTRLDALAPVAPAPTPMPSLAAKARPPNILVYLVDTLRTDRVGARRGERPLTPVLDDLLRRSFVFDRALAQAPWTRPAVATMLTGMLPSQHRAIDDPDALPDAAVTLPEILAKAGYATAAVVANANVGFEIGFAQGYDRFVPLYRRERFPAARPCHREAMKWLAERPRGRPYFLMVHVIEPHAPYLPAEEFRTLFAPGVRDPSVGEEAAVSKESGRQDGPERGRLKDLEALYDAEVAEMDARLGEFMASLETSGDLDDTLFVFIADHGEQFWEHGALLHGKSLNVEELWIPLFFRWPGGSVVGKSSEWAQQADLLPTLLDAVGIETPEGVAGRSLVPLMTTGEPSASAPIFAELSFKGVSSRAVIWEGRKVIETKGGVWGSQVELYDVARDFLERHDHAGTRRIEASFVAQKWRELATGRRLEGQRLHGVPPEVEEQLRALGYLR